MRLRLLLLVAAFPLLLLNACLVVDDDDDEPADDDDDDDDIGAVPCPDGLNHAASTSAGCLQGGSAGDGSAFKGVPYAAAPVGALRWAAPTEVTAWTDPRDATSFGSVCVQTNGSVGGEPGPGDGDEDCLFLNVWTPDLDAVGLPILFFTHGGSHTDGAGSEALYDGTLLAARGAVVVTHNYRLAQMGFFAHPELSEEADDGSSGNQALRDSAFALSWIRENAEVFGGDPDQVMVFGESAGSVTTCLFLVSPLTEGQFRSAVLESGTCQQVSILLDEPGDGDAESAEEQGQRFAEALGCAGPDEQLECMRAASTEEVMETLPAGSIENGNQGERWSPIVDGGFITEPVRDAIGAGRFHDVAVMAGTNGDEGTLFTAGFNVDTAAAAQGVVGAVATTLGFDEAGAQAIWHPDHYDSPRAAFEAMWGDVVFNCPTRTTLRALAEHGSVWQYGFDHVPAVFGALGACHGCELVFVFGNGAVTNGELELSREMQEAWIAMATDGLPISTDLGEWTRFEPGDAEPYTLLIDPPSADVGWMDRACDFLDEEGWQQYP